MGQIPSRPTGMGWDWDSKIIIFMGWDRDEYLWDSGMGQNGIFSGFFRPTGFSSQGNIIVPLRFFRNFPKLTGKNTTKLGNLP